MKEELKRVMHDKAIRLINTGLMTRTELAEVKLGISRTTLNTRLEKANWRIGELYILKSL
ncbi:MAG: hypothetical protein GY928_14875 [Colwellia sp.]|nr:hypothetical protein [Colwellia sp.]